MKFIKPFVYSVITTLAVSVFTLHGFSQADGILLGTISGVDDTAKEVLVKKDKPGSEIKTGTRLYTRNNGKIIILEAVKPMYAHVKCRPVQRSDFNILKKDMKVYLYDGRAAEEAG